MNNTATSVDVVALAAELANVLDAKKRLETREKDIKAMLRALGEGTHEAGALKVIVSPNRRVSESRVKEHFPITEFPHFWKQSPNLDVIKASIAPLMYENLMSPVGDPKVTVK